MKKRLLIAFAGLATAFSGFAHDVESFVYSHQGRFQIIGENLCTNGTCADNFDGWTAITASEATPSTIFIYDGDKASFSSQKADATEGMYYKFTPSLSSSTYIVSFKIRQQTYTYPYCTNAEYTLSDEGNKYGAPANMASTAGLNDINLVGTEIGKGYLSNSQFVSCGAGFTLTTDWNTVNFAIIGDGIDRDYYLMFAGMNTGVEIADVQIQEAIQVADLRQRNEALDYVSAYKSAFGGLDTKGLDEIITSLNEINDASAQEELDGVLEGVNDVVADFIASNGIEDFIASCATNTNWMGWHKDTRGITNQMGDWRFDTSSPGGRWRDWNGFNCNDALNSPAYGHANGARGTQEMYMTKSLKKGSYLFAFDGAQYSCYKGNGNYAWMFGLETGAMDMTLTNNATNEVVAMSSVSPLPAARLIDNLNNNIKTSVINYIVPEDGEYTFKISFNDNLPEGMTAGNGGVAGGSFVVQNPRIYCKLDGYSAAETAYYDNVMAQINAARGKVTEGKELLENENKFWGKDALNDSIAKFEPIVAAYEAMDQASIIATFDPETYQPGATNENALMEHEVYVEAAKPLIDAVNAFNNKNNELAKLGTAITNAETILNDRMYTYATGKDEFVKAINDAKDVDASLKADEYSEENVNKITDAINALNTAAEAYKATIPADKITAIVDIDFSKEAEETEIEGAFKIDGALGTMEFPAGFTKISPTGNEKGLGVMNFEQGLDVNGAKENADVLRVGNGDASVILNAEITDEDILHVSCDFWYVRLSDSYTGFYLKNENNENVSGINVRAYNNDADYNPCNITIANYIPSNTIGDIGSYTDDNKTHMDFYLDYGSKKMYAATQSSSRQQITEKVDFDGSAITSFVLHSSAKLSSGMSYIGRRSWFDNLKIEKIAAGPYDGIKETVVTSPVSSDVRYNAAGQIVNKSYKGLVITKNGKFVQK